MTKEIKEKRRKYISKMPLLGKIGVYLGVILIWYEPRSYAGMYWQCEKINAYNPLTYIGILIVIPFSAIGGIIELFKTLPKFFKIRRWG